MNEPSIDFRSNWPPARNQGSRPTCLAFASSDAHGSLHPEAVPLSAEYAHYAAAKRAPVFDPHRANRIADMIGALEIDGRPSEPIWPYLVALPTDLTSYGP